ncbi:UNVERIFIED_CONTAM: hypothetical protein HDU68_001121 [Siphonaria sp. JEL0065]|nr:hypothetical protein HDU68_001121 [Siphonaria sp. JEL0065]
MTPPPLKEFDNTNNTVPPQKQQNLKRIRLILNRGSAAVAAEELNMSRMSISDLVPKARQSYDQQLQQQQQAQSNQGSARQQKPQMGRSSNSSRDQQKEYTQNTPSYRGKSNGGSAVIKDIDSLPIRGSTQSSIHRPASYSTSNNNAANSESNSRAGTAASLSAQTSGGYPQFELPDEEEEGAGNIEDVERIPCPICQRKFAGEERLEKHVGACSKMKQRKIFDATKARVKGTELEQYALKKQFSESSSSKKATDKPIKAAKQNWRVKHEHFIRMVRSNRSNPDDKSGGGAPLVSEPDPDYVQCDHCGRRFNETAAERHIPICANTKHRPKPAANKGGALGSSMADDEARMRKRLDFKPPPPKVRKSPEKTTRK